MSFSFDGKEKSNVAFAKVPEGTKYKTLYYNVEPIYSDTNIKRIASAVQKINNGLGINDRMDKNDITSMCEAIATGNPGKCNKKIFDMVKNEIRSSDLGNAYIKMSGGIQPIPKEIKGQTEVIYVTGPQGVGKSYFINQYAKNYRELFEDNPIIMFSRNTYDDSIDDSIVTRINKSKLLKDPWNIEGCPNALYIFDDIEYITPKEEKIAVEAILHDAIMNGRKLNIRVIYARHIARDFSQTKNILLEATSYVIFPGQADKQNIGLMKDYLGMDKKEIKAINSRASRWIMLTRAAPQMVITETGVYMRDYFK